MDKKNRLRLILRIAGGLFILAAIGVVIYNLFDEARAGKKSADVMNQMSQIVVETSENTASEAAGISETGAVDEADEEDSPERVIMPVVEIDGDPYIGVISIPDLDLVLPVMSGWNYELLKKAPCRYSGSAYYDNMTICAHNYAKHFGRINELPVGTKVSFKDMDGIVYEYAVETVERIQPDDFDYIAEGTGCLTLFTCTPGGALRVAVRCRRQ